MRQPGPSLRLSTPLPVTRKPAAAALGELAALRTQKQRRNKSSIQRSSSLPLDFSAMLGDFELVPSLGEGQSRPANTRHRQFLLRHLKEPCPSHLWGCRTALRSLRKDATHYSVTKTRVSRPLLKLFRK